MRISHVAVATGLLIAACNCGQPSKTAGSPDLGHSSVTVDRAMGVIADGHDHATVTITLENSLGAPIAGKLVKLTATGTGDLIAQPMVTDAKGHATGTLASTVAELKTLTATIDSLTLTQHPTVQFVAGAAAMLAFTTQPANVQAGATFPMVQVAVVDSNGNVVTGSWSPISLGLSTSVAGAMLQGTLSVSPVGGVASFSDLQLAKAGRGYTLRATTDGLASATSEPFDVTAAPASQLAFTVQPSTVQAGQPMTPAVQVTVEDPYGNAVPTASDAVTLSVGAGAAGATLAGTLTVTPSAGVAVFPDLSLVTAGTAYTLSASAGQLPKGMSAPFDVLAGPKAKLGFAVQPSSAQAGVAITPAIQVAVEDQFGNVVPTAMDPVTIGLATSPTGAVLAGTGTLPAGDGLAVFSDLTLNLPGSYTLSASADGLTGATSAQLTVSAGPPARLVFMAQPPNATAGATLAPPVQVVLEDAVGNVEPTATGPVTLAIATHGGPGKLSGTLTITASAGVATFSDLSIDKAGTGYTLAATASGYAGATSALFNVAPGAPSSMLSSIKADRTDVTADGTSTVTLTVTVEDAQGNPIPGTGVVLSSSGSANTITPPSGTTSPGGVFLATLASTKAETKTVTATIGQTTISTTVTFVGGTPSQQHSALTATPSSVSTDGMATTTLTVTVEDGYGNPVPAQVVSLSVTGQANTLTPASGVTDGTGTFTATLSSTTAETKTVKATVGSFILTTTVTFVPGAVSGKTSTLVASPTSVTADGISVSTLTVTVEDAGGNVVSGQTVSLDTPGQGSHFSPMSGTTDANGIFVAKVASTVAQTETVTATIGSASVSTAVTFVAGSADRNHSTLTATPSSVRADGMTTTTLTVLVADAFGNPVSDQAVTISSSGSGNTLTPTAGSTGADGTFSATLASTTGETKTIMAVVGTYTLTTQVTFVPQFAVVNATVGTLGQRPAPVNGMQVVDDGLEYLPPACSGQFCVNGGIVP